MKRILLPSLIVLVSFIYGLPHIILTSKLGAEYTPFSISGESRIARDETYAYAPEVNYILKGHLFLKDAYVSEYANYPTPFMGESVPSIVFALLSKLTGSMENAFIAADFIFPPIIFLLFFLLTRRFVKNNLLASSIAFVAVVARDFIAVVPYPQQTFQYLTIAEGQDYLLYFSRAFHPQLTFIFFALAFMFFLNLVEKPNSKKFLVLSGISFGVLFYSYVFYWTYFVVFLGLNSIYFLARREKSIIIALLKSSAISLMIAIPYLFNMYKFYQLDLATDFVTKSSLQNMPLPITLVRYLLVAVLFFITAKKRNNKFFVFLSFLLAGVLITPISKLLIGQDLETFHYLRRALMPFATIAFFITIYSAIKNKRYLNGFLSIVLFITFITFALNTQIIVSRKIKDSHVRNHDQERVSSWLNANTPKDSVVGSLSTDFESLVPVYTQNKVFFPPTDRTIMPTSEGVTRYAILSNILGVDMSWQKKNLDNIVSYLFIYQSYNPNLNLDLNSPKRFLAEGEIEKVSQNWQNEVNKFKLDYVVVTPEEKLVVNPNSRFLYQVASFGDYRIYNYKAQ